MKKVFFILFLSLSLIGLSNKSDSLYIIGDSLYYSENYESALVHYRMADTCHNGNTETSIVDIVNSIAYIELQLGNYDIAHQEYQRSLSITKDEIIKAKIYVNIGDMFYRQNLLEKSENYISLAMIIYKANNNSDKIAKCYNFLGSIFNKQKKFKKSIIAYNKALSILEDSNEKMWCYSNISTVYLNINNLELSSIYYDSAKLVNIKNISVDDIVAMDINYSLLLSDAEKFTSAIFHVNDAIEICKENGMLNRLHEAYTAKSDILLTILSHHDNNDYINLFKTNMNLIEDLETELKNRNVTDIVLELETKYNTNKKDLELKRQKHIRNTILIALSITVLLLISLSLLYKNLRKQKNIILDKNTEIESKNNVIESRNKEMVESIEYAKGLQDALLSNSDQQIDVETEFVLFEPKDIVSGDFYWMNKKVKSSTYCVSDCTGHGVPGAFISALGINNLSEIVNNKIAKEPSDILLNLDEKISNTLKSRNDGMDITIVKLKDNILSCSGANNPIYIVRNVANVELSMDGLEESVRTKTHILYKVKTDKTYIGENKLDNYTQVDVKLEKGDSFYMITDGYADQFGGSKNKKFMYKKLQRLLLSMQSMSMLEQKDKLKSSLENWMGDNEQVDDITILGKKIGA